MQLPESFVRNMRHLLGDDADPVLGALADDPVVSIRRNPLKTVGTLPVDRVPWASEAAYLTHHEAFTFDPLFHAGGYYVQEASSMFLEQVVRQYVPSAVTALDLCAAPGGKSTLLRSVLPAGSLLVSNEIIPSRAQVLCENITKWGSPDCVVTSNAPSSFGRCEGCFDLVLCDVPCSGEGMFRKDPVAVAEWSEANVALCMARGQEILRGVWPALRDGGLLVYSTCTFNPDEDERQVLFIAHELGADVLPLELSDGWGITGSLLSSDPGLPCYHFLPGRTRGEGFFLAVLRKKGGTSIHTEEPVSSSVRCKGKNTQATLFPAECRRWVRDAEMYEWRIEGNNVIAVPLPHASFVNQLCSQLHVLQSGLCVAEQKGSDTVPTAALALSTALQRGVFAEAELTWQQAMSYLRREALTLSSDTPRGMVLLTYRGLPLGFAKNVGNRANNLYPAEWRIRTTHLPDKETCVLQPC